MTALAIDNLASAAEAARCAHCGLDVPAGLIEPDAPHQFCCAGCRCVFETLHACGLDAFYRLRDIAGTPARPTESKFEAFDAPAFDKTYVRKHADDLFSVDFLLEGVDCAACVWLIERLPTVVAGVIEARLSLRQAIVRITWNPRRVALSQVARALDRLGYTPHPAREASRQQFFLKEQRQRLINLSVAGAIAGNSMLVAFALYAGRAGTMEDSYRQYFRWISLLFGMLSVFWPGWIFFRGALAALRVRTVNFDLPITLALLAGSAAGVVNVLLHRGDVYFDSLTVLVFLLLVGRFLQFRQQRMADSAVELLFSLAPATCRVVGAHGRAEELPIEAVGPGDLIEVLSGQTIAADGIVETGSSHILQALLTGEPAPVAVSPGARVFRGTQNQGAALRIRVTNVGAQSRVGKLMEIVERGIQEKPAIVQFTDRVGPKFVAAVSLAALATFAFWARFSVPAAVDHAVALLIVACPCAIGLATPVTLAVAIGKLARRDILVKSGAALENLARPGTLFLDKTGTITHGNLRLLAWQGDESLKPSVAELEAQSQHPVARALCGALGAFHSNSLTEVRERGDGGISALLDGQPLLAGSPTFLARHGVKPPDDLLSPHGTTVLIARNGEVKARAVLGDQIRTDSASVLAELRRDGWRTSILSGDASIVVQSVARVVGIDPRSALGELTPEAKLAALRPPGPSAGPVVMVGDGVNDAAALAAADVGIAVHGGAEASLAAADVYIAVPGLRALADLFHAATKTMRTIRINLAISLGYNLIAGVLAATGYMNPLVAAVLMPLSSVSVLGFAAASVRRIDSPKSAQPGETP